MTLKATPKRRLNIPSTPTLRTLKNTPCLTKNPKTRKRETERRTSVRASPWLQGVPRATPEPPTEASRFYYKGFKSYKTKYAPCGSPKPTYTPKPKPYCKASSFCTKCAAGEYSSYYDKYCAKWCCGKTYYSCVETTEMEAMCTE